MVSDFRFQWISESKNLRIWIFHNNLSKVLKGHLKQICRKAPKNTISRSSPLCRFLLIPTQIWNCCQGRLKSGLYIVQKQHNWCICTPLWLFTKYIKRLCTISMLGSAAVCRFLSRICQIFQLLSRENL